MKVAKKGYYELALPEQIVEEIRKELQTTLLYILT